MQDSPPLHFPSAAALPLLVPGLARPRLMEIEFPLDLRHCISGETRLSYTTIIWLVEAFRDLLFIELQRIIGRSFDTYTRDIDAGFFSVIELPALLTLRARLIALSSTILCMQFLVGSGGFDRAHVAIAQRIVPGDSWSAAEIAAMRAATETL